MDKTKVEESIDDLKFSVKEKEELKAQLSTIYKANIEDTVSWDLFQNQLTDLTNTLQENKETSSIPQYNGVYFDPSLPDNDGSGKQTLFNITYHNKLTNKQETATFARKEGIQQVFNKHNIPVTDCKNTLEATQKIKEMFARCQKDFPDLWEQVQWVNGNNFTDLFKLFSNKDKGILNNTDYAGFQGAVGGAFGKNASCQYIPLRVAGEFVYLWSDLASEEADFSIGGDYANLVWAFSC